MSVSKNTDKQLNDMDVKRKAVRLVVAHLKKKVSKEYKVLSILSIGLLKWMNFLKGRNSISRSTIP
jgi:hypothetical protein